MSGSSKTLELYACKDKSNEILLELAVEIHCLSLFKVIFDVEFDFTILSYVWVCREVSVWDEFLHDDCQ